jgi:hypothetical protein
VSILQDSAALIPEDLLSITYASAAESLAIERGNDTGLRVN